MKLIVADTEADSLNPTKFHVISYQEDGEIRSATSERDMKNLLLREDITLVMHNGCMWDVPNLERVLGITIKAKVIDTLALSWYLYPTRIKHGIASWGEEFGVPKPVVEDWQNLPLETYVERCREDVKINVLLWKKQKKLLSVLYGVPEDEVSKLPIISYLMFKLDCVREQERSRWKLDLDLCNNTLATLYPAKEEKVEALKKAMPFVNKYAMREYPKAPFKKDGTLSVQGVKWLQLLKEQGLPENHKLPIKVVVSTEPPNPNSHTQLKDWLFSLGWEPATFKYVKEDDGTQRAIPQVQTEDDDRNKMLCPSVLILADKEPAIEQLDGLFVMSHRISILEGFLENQEDGFVKATMQGFTNTLRLKHRVVVNLPGVDKAYGKEIRGSLIAREGCELCGSDMASLEDMCKRHYIYEYDPDYVNEMSKEGFDPHLDLAKFAGRITEEDLALYIENKKKKDLSDNLAAVIKAVARVRKPFKVVNYSATYGIGPPKLARSMGVPEKEAKALLKAFWERNFAIRKVAEAQKIVTINGQMWLFNPVSKFWYSLRYEKDIFSTLNQGTGVYCFDSWLAEIRKKRKQLTATFHDEGVWEILKGNREKMKELLISSIEKVNERLKLNVKLSVDVQFGNNYASIH